MSNKAKVDALASVNMLSLIAIDEAHLISEWSAFRPAFFELKELKQTFKNIPLMALTATATPETEEEVRHALRCPVIRRASINRPNITLNVDELPVDKSTTPAIQFASRAVEICGTTTIVVYTDFIADIGPIVRLSAFHELGFDAVGYHGNYYT